MSKIGKLKTELAGESCAQNTQKHPGVRPSLYKPEYCEEIINYFTSKIDPIRESRNDKGNLTLLFQCFPTFEQFAETINVSQDTLLNWCKVHEEFLGAYTRAKQIQLHVLKIGGLSGAYNSNIVALLLSNDYNINKSENHNIGGQNGSNPVQTETDSTSNREIARMFLFALERDRQNKTNEGEDGS